jgi:hypothetical protein
VFTLFVGALRDATVASVLFTTFGLAVACAIAAFTAEMLMAGSGVRADMAAAGDPPSKPDCAAYATATAAPYLRVSSVALPVYFVTSQALDVQESAAERRQQARRRSAVSSLRHSKVVCHADVKRAPTEDAIEMNRMRPSRKRFQQHPVPIRYQGPVQASWDVSNGSKALSPCVR